MNDVEINFINISIDFQYLEENVHQTYVDVGVMARHLQEKYREYARRKHQPFRFLVDQGRIFFSFGKST